MLFTQADNILFADEGFAAGKETGMGAQFLCLGQHPVHLLKGQTLLMAVFRRPAAGAVHIAGGGRIHQNQPGNIAAVFFGVFLRLLVAAEAALVHCIGQERFKNIGVGLIQQPLDIMRPLAIGLVGNHMQHFKGFFFPHAALDLFGHIHQILRRRCSVLSTSLFNKVIQYLFKSLAFCRVGGLFHQCHKFPFLSR